MRDEWAWAVVALVLVAMLTRILLDARVVQEHELPRGVLSAHADDEVVEAFPPHVRLRGFASADFQDGGGYATDLLLAGKLSHLPGVASDWSWRASDNSCPPKWASGILPFMYHRGNGATDHRWRDTAGMRRLGANAARVSLSWPKLQPRGPDTPFDAAYTQSFLAHVADLQANGLTVMCTVLHFVLPAWFAGWNATGEHQLEQFAAQVAARFPPMRDAHGDEWWITINEPTIYALHSYILAARPPGEASFPQAVRVLASMCRAHVRMARTLRRARGPRTNVSMACNVVPFAPRNALSPLDAATACVVDALFNRAVLSLLLHGSCWVGPFHVRGESAEELGPAPFIAVNHYTRVTCSLLDSLELDHEIQPDGAHENDLCWDARVDHFYSVLRSIISCHPQVRIVVSEHGLPDEYDRSRPRLLAETSRMLKHCPQVLGYFHWTYLDNVEWDIGIGARFGVVAVNYDTLARIPRRKSAQVIRTLYRAGNAARRRAVRL